MSGLDQWGMDVFKVAVVTNCRPLTAITYTIFQVPKCFLFVISISVLGQEISTLRTPVNKDICINRPGDVRGKLVALHMDEVMLIC